MPDVLQQAVRVLLHGLLTELPAQLATAAIVALVAGANRAWRRRTSSAKSEPGGSQNSS